MHHRNLIGNQEWEIIRNKIPHLIKDLLLEKGQLRILTGLRIHLKENLKHCQTIQYKLHVNLTGKGMKKNKGSTIEKFDN